MSSTTPTTTTPAPTPDPGTAAKAQAKQALLAYLSKRFDVLQLFLLTGYGIMFTLCVVLILYLRYNRNFALKGDAGAARKLILPAFEPLLWILGAATGCYTLFFCTALVTNFYTTDIPKLATEAFYSGRQFVFVIVVVFMLQKSVSIPALRRTVLISFVLSTYTLPIVWYMVTYGKTEDFYWVLTISRALLLLLYTYVLVYPPGRASKRSLREFCLFTYVYYTLLFIYNEMYHESKTDLGFNLTYVNLLWGSLCPLVIWRVLQADTEYWRGMGQRAAALQSFFRQKHNINEHISSQGLHVLIEMHRKYIIDFAYLELRERIGIGASAIVFNGVLHSSTPVAIKVYTPSDFTEETVAEFSHEAALCGTLHHPNIVKFYGMCVVPPTICLVSELCQGSLMDVTLSIAQREQSPERQQFLINIGYMIDAARAVAYIHSFSPAFLHRDIKPENFLVDSENNVKLTDFGESRSIPRTQIEKNDVLKERSSNKEQKKNSRSQGAMNSAVAKLQRIGSTGFLELSSIVAMSPPVSIAASSPKDAHAPLLQMTVKGTVDYMAPEVINGRAGLASYGEAADVYSLAITMWDILNPGDEKYPMANGGNHFQIFELVLDGKRPQLDPRLHVSLREVIESAWQADPRMRPSAQNIVDILESIQEEVAAVLALQVFDELNQDQPPPLPVMNKRKHEKHEESSLIAPSPSFSGDEIVQYLETQGVVYNSDGASGEAIRMGNALMDAGLLHHVKHARPFENAEDVRYFFDEDTIRFCHPIAFLEPLNQEEAEATGEASTTDPTHAHTREHSYNNIQPSKLSIVSSSQTNTSKFQPSNSRSDRTSSQSMCNMTENGVCLCRKLGQRVESVLRTKASRHHHHHFRRKLRRKQQPRDKDAATSGKDKRSESLGLTAKLLRKETHLDEFDELSGFETVAEAEASADELV
ncbi:Tkl protein kinase [Globisporangium polare]